MNIKKIAKNIINDNNMSDLKYPDIEKIVENYGIKVNYYELKRTNLHIFKYDIYSYIKYSNNNRFEIFIDNRLDDRSKRYFLTRELSRYILDKDRIKRTKLIYSGIVNSDYDKELENNIADLTTELLIPDDSISSDISYSDESICSLINEFNVCESTAIVKLLTKSLNSMK